MTVGVPAGERIAVNAAIVGERPTGLGLYALALIKALDELGELLVVFTSCPELVEARHALVRPIPAATRPERGALGHLRRLLWTQTGLRAGVRRAGSRLILNVMPEGLLAPGVPQATVIHDVLPLHYPEEYPRQQYYFRYFVPAVLRASRAVIVSSENTRRDLLRFYRLAPDTLHVVMAGCDTDRFTPAEPDATPDGDPYALYVGNVMPHKNLLRIVDAFASVARGRPRRLLIRGWGRRVHVENLQARIRTAGIGAHVDWQPYAAAEDLPRLYRRARMLLLPSLYEGFGLTALEAMACGTPVITSNVSSLPEVVGDAALLIDPRETAALADAIDRLFTDDVAVHDLAQRGLARARLLSWRRTGEAVQAIVQQTGVMSR